MDNNKKKKRFIKLLGILASIATIIGTIYAILQTNNNINIGDDNEGIIITGDGNTINQNNVEKLSVNEIKKRAQKFYEDGNYKEVIKLYLLDNAQNDPIVLNNLGYMYAKGIGTDKNMEKAYTYFKKNVAINMNEEYVLSNYAIFLLNSKEKNYIKEGIWVIKHQELKNTLFINNLNYLSIPYYLDDKIDISDKEYTNFVNKYYIDISYYEVLDASVSIEVNEFIDYKLVNEYFDNDGNSSNLIIRYLVVEKLFSLDGKSALDIGFIET